MPAFFTTVSFICLASISHAQHSHPASWLFKAQPVSNNDIIFNISAALQPGWHIYSLTAPGDSPAKTKISLSPSDQLTFTGPWIEHGKPTLFYDAVYEMQICQYSDNVTFSRRARLTDDISTVTITGTLEYVACSREICIPEQQPFTITYNATSKQR